VAHAARDLGLAPQAAPEIDVLHVARPQRLERDVGAAVHLLGLEHDAGAAEADAPADSVAAVEHLPSQFTALVYAHAGPRFEQTIGSRAP
jgi:hypothetical protein